MQVIIPNELTAAISGVISRGIRAAEVTQDGHLVLTLTDGSKADLGSVRGEQGEPGQPGPAGPQGAAGPAGPKGDPGAQGETGRGFAVLGYYATAAALAAAVQTPAAGDAYGIGSAAPYDIYIYDGVTHAWVNNGALQGAKGEKGDKGDKGDTGAAGATGAAGPTGPAGPAGPAGAPGAEGEPGPNLISAETATALTGLLKGNGTHVELAVPGTDYLAESDFFACTVTSSGSAYLCDKTPAQIMTAVQAGKKVLAAYNNATYFLSGLSQTVAQFSRTAGTAAEIITVRPTGAATIATTTLQAAASAVSSVSGTTLKLADNTEYRLTGVQTLTITFPTGKFECWLRIETAGSGTIAVTLPETAKYIGDAPVFGTGETWELSVKDGVVVAGKASA